MLRSLYIRDYALIEELEVDFGPGLNIITGETGAGKSIVIGALKMILGERASTEVVRTGARKAIIEGVFDEADTPVINALLEENQIDSGEQIIMRREITASQSRAFINDSPATVQLLKEVAANLIDLHGQHEHQSLLRTETHLQMVDQFGALDGDRREYERRYKEISALERERRSLVAREQDLRQQRDLIAFQINEIDQVDPQPDEETRLRDERRVLENAEQLFEATQGLNEMLYASEQAVQDVLVTARNELRELSGIDPSFSELASEIETAETIVAEVARSLQQYNAGIEFNPERLEEIRLRTMAIEGLKRKYGGALESVIEHRRSIGETYELAADFEGAITRLEERISKARTGLSEAAIALSEKRKEVAARIRKMIEAELGALGMNDARFEVRFDVAVDPNGWVSLADGTNVDARADGIDVAEFYISTNVGETPRPLARVASGGEISRIMLALKSILAKSERLPILVFDEIDTGISGAVARRVGRSMAELARFHQIIAITHLPQIAALGDIHLRVSKFVEDGRTKTYMHRLGDEARAAQVASLIAGGGVTDAALESARGLMGMRRCAFLAQHFARFRALRAAVPARADLPFDRFPTPRACPRLTLRCGLRADDLLDDRLRLWNVLHLQYKEFHPAFSRGNTTLQKLAADDRTDPSLIENAFEEMDRRGVGSAVDNVHMLSRLMSADNIRADSSLIVAAC